MKGIATEKTERPDRAKSAATADVFIPMLDQLGHDRVRDVRDRAILLFGVASSLRRAELCALDLSDLTWRDEGIAALIRRSKTDRTGRGRYVAVPRSDANPARCPVRAVREWLACAEIEQGPLFQSLWKDGRPRGSRLPPGEVAQAVKRAARAAGLDPALFGGHSLRAGYVTQARREGLSWETIMEQTGHKKIETVKRYARDPADAFRTAHVDQVWKAFDRDVEKG
jgi:integrase